MKYKGIMCSIICAILLCATICDGSVKAEEDITASRPNDAGQGIVQLTSEKGQPKVISVVYDNSSSMVKKDRADDHVTRWIEADYTVKALAAMMDTGDILRLYIMSGYREDVKTREMSTPGEIKIGEEKWKAVKEVENYFEKMKLCYYTYYQGVTEAAEDMKPYLEEGKDCWIVILTDGFFWDSKGSMEAKTLDGELHEITTSGNYGEGIKVAYIPIGDKGETAEIQEDIKNGIYVADADANSSPGGQESLILKKVTNIINRIYGRVRLEHQIEKEYLPSDEKDINFRFDIPLDRLIVFMQYSGPEERYEDYEERQNNLENTDRDGIEIEIGVPSVPGSLSLSDEADFAGRDTLPEYEDGKLPYSRKNVKYKELWGKMLSYTKKSPSRSGSEAEELVIPVNSDRRPDVEIYYQPAIKVGLEYIQNGESVNHIEGCLSSTGGESHEEYCLQEGEVIVRVKLLDDYGEELTKVNSGLLYKDRFSVCLKPVDEKEWQTMEPTGVDYEFRTYLEQQDYQIKVITPWDEQKTGVLKVQEKRKMLEILPLDTEKIMINESEEGASLIAIRVDEDGITPPMETVLQMAVDCSCDNETLTMVPVESMEQGVWLFRPVLYNSQNPEAPKEVLLHAFASRPYAVGEPETAELEIVLPVGSYPEELIVGLESDKAVKASSLLWPVARERILVSYTCRDILSEEKKCKVLNQDIQVKPASIAPYISLEEDGNIYIKRSFFKWFFANETSAEITFHSSYNLWNTQNEADVMLILKFHVIPVWVRYLIGILILLMIVWIVMLVARNHTYRYIPRLQVKLQAAGGYEYDIKQNRRRHRVDPSCNYCFLYYKNGNQEGNHFIPDLQIQIQKNRLGSGYEIINYSDFMDADQFAIEEEKISEENRTINDVKKFSLKDKIGITFYLIIEK